MLASPKASSLPQLPSAKRDQSTHETSGHASLLPRWCRPCTPTALLQLPVASAHTGVSQSRREGAQVTWLLPFPQSLPPAGLGPVGIALQQHSRLSLQPQVLLLLQWEQQTHPRLLPTLNGPWQPQCPPRSSYLPIPHEQSNQHPSPTRGRCPSPRPLIGSDERHAAGRTHVSHNLNHLRAF